MSASTSWITSSTHSSQNVSGIQRFHLCRSHSAHLVTKNSITVSKNSNKVPILLMICSSFPLFCEKLFPPRIPFCVPRLKYKISFCNLHFIHQRYVASSHNQVLNENSSLSHTGSGRTAEDILPISHRNTNLARTFEHACPSRPI